MYKYGLFILLFALVAQAQLKDPSLFRVHGSHGDSYLLGTIHVGVDLNEFPVNVSGLIQKSRSLLPEIDFTDSELALYQTDPYRAYAQHSPFFRADLDWQTKQRLAQFGIPDYIVNTLGDSDCGVLSPLIEIRERKMPMDLQIIASGHANHLFVRALDSTELRKQARSAQDQSEGQCSLREIFSNHSDAEILSALQKDNQSEIDSYRNGTPISTEELNTPVVVLRNEAWLPAIESEINQGRAFVAVGQAHLFGEHGLLRLLQKDGYEITQINGPSP